MWNTITIQYSPLIEEEWDEHFKVQYNTVEYTNQYSPLIEEEVYYNNSAVENIIQYSQLNQGRVGLTLKGTVQK